MLATNNYTHNLSKLPTFSDEIGVDALCSGEGIFRKDAHAMLEWSEENVRLCAQRQQRILADVWEALRPGGMLIYSTCTWSKSENEQNMAWLAAQEQAESIEVALKPE